MIYQRDKGLIGKSFNKRKIGRQSLLVAGIFGMAITAASFNFGGNWASATVPGNNVRANLSGSGSQTSSDGVGGSISRDGRFVVFSNPQNNFVGTDWGSDSDVFVRDLNSNSTSIISVSTSGAQADDDSYRPIISETGRYVVFYSIATNLIDGRTISAATGQMYMRDTATNTTSILSEVSSGVFANSDMQPLDVSTDGRYVMFKSRATNLGPVVGSGFDNVFLLDRDTSTFSWVNEPAAGTGYTGYSPKNASMNCDGAFIAIDGAPLYYGLASTLHTDVLLIDMRGGKKVTNITASANGAALRPEISCNGNYIGFASYANNLDPLTAGLAINYHAFIYDRINATFDLLDQSSSGTRANAYVMTLSSQQLHLTLSDKGTAVFRSGATNLVAGVNGMQLYLRDPVVGTTELITRDSGGTQGNNDSNMPFISLDGSVVAYESYSTNLVSGDANSQRDTFVSETGY